MQAVMQTTVHASMRKGVTLTILHVTVQVIMHTVLQGVIQAITHARMHDAKQSIRYTIM